MSKYRKQVTVKHKHKTNDSLGLFIILALLIILGLIAVNDPDPDTGYDPVDVAALNKLSADSATPRTNAEKLIWLFADDGGYSPPYRKPGR